LKKGAPFADSAGRFSATIHDWGDRGGLRNPQKGLAADLGTAVPQKRSIILSLAKIAKDAKKTPKKPFPKISFAISAIVARENQFMAEGLAHRA
jgi:hypothetical protein